jgi:hypothetical protein
METLLTKSNALLNEISPIISVGPDRDDKRWSGSWIMCDIALEHAHSLQNFNGDGKFHFCVFNVTTAI